MQKPEMTSKAP